MERIKVGDIVRVAEYCPKLGGLGMKHTFASKNSKINVMKREPCCETLADLVIKEGDATIYMDDIPTKYLIKVNAEPKEPTDDLKKTAEEYANAICNGLREYGANCRLIMEEAIVEAYWAAYTDDLAKEIVLKIVGSQLHNHTPSEIGQMAVDVAKSVVENLKKREE